MFDGLTVGEPFRDPPPWLECLAALSLIAMPIFVGYHSGWQAGLSLILLGAIAAVAVTNILTVWAQLFALITLGIGWVALAAFVALSL